jgi:hypothetical protein
MPFSIYILLNPPFNKCRTFMMKALNEWKRGCNIAMIVPSLTLYCDDFFEKIFSKIATCSQPRKETFEGYSGPFGKDVTIVYLL